MAIDKSVFVTGLLITLLLMAGVFVLSGLLNNEREDALIENMNEVVREYEDMQTLMLMADVIGEESTCIALESALTRMDKNLWDLGVKIDQYRQVNEEFTKDPFFIQQKKDFNRREVLYFTLLHRMEQTCQVNQLVISYFYKKKENCADCDAQSFVLSDIKHDLEGKDKGQELAVFSFDTELDIPAIDLLTKYFEVDSYPCIIIDGQAHCGLQDKKALMEKLCAAQDLSICS